MINMSDKLTEMQSQMHQLHEELKTLRIISFRSGGPSEPWVSQKTKFEAKMKETESILQEIKTQVDSCERKIKIYREAAESFEKIWDESDSPCYESSMLNTVHLENPYIVPV